MIKTFTDSVGKVDPAKKKIKGAKNPKKAKGAKTTTRVGPKELVRRCKRKAEAQFRKCAKGFRGGNAGGNFLAHQGFAKSSAKKICSPAREHGDDVTVVIDLFISWNVLCILLH